MYVSYSLSCVWLWLHGLWLARLLCPWNSPGKNTRVGCHSLLQGIFPTQGSNLGLLHCRQILHHLSHGELWKMQSVWNIYLALGGWGDEGQVNRLKELHCKHWKNYHMYGILIFYWNIVNLQCFISFKYTATWWWFSW